MDFNGGNSFSSVIPLLIAINISVRTFSGS